MVGWRWLGAAIAALSMLSAVPRNGAAQSYPQQPVRVLVPSAAGGPTDVPARIVAEGLSNLMGQRFVVENRVGAGGVIAAGAVARAEPNGYTLLYANSSVLAILPAFHANMPNNPATAMPYDPDTAFTLVGFASNSPQLLVVNPKLPFKTVKEMLAYAKANPDRLNFASGGVGTLPHLTYELFKVETGLSAVHVPYGGGAPALVAVMAGEADILFDLVRTRVKSGEVRALAITGQTRDADLPDIPTIAESGFPAVTSTSWTGLVAPAGTPKEIVALLNAKLNELVRNPEFQSKMKSLGLIPKGGTSEEFAAWVSAERQKWTRVVKVSGATLN
jgi:tripartite-type tricarboxylate transporter receptor subunit TctC